MSAANGSKRRRTMTNEFLKNIDDVRIDSISPLLPPACVMEALPIDKVVAETVSGARSSIQSIVSLVDDRIFAVVGPCSVHDVDAALEYAGLLKGLAEEVKDDVLVVMRTYFEKPRTTVGWKGLINDPFLNGSFLINKGIKKARKFLLAVNRLGLPCAGEFLDTITPQFVADLISWGAIGARTTESQVHRELASGLSCPVGFKNATSGEVQVAIDSCLCSREGHSFLSVTKDGIAAIVHTKGNPGCHIILRGGRSGPNYASEYVKEAKVKLNSGGVKTGIMIDCSHGNSNKNHKNQEKVCEDICKQLLEEKELFIMGVMIESNLKEGNQKLDPGVTDVCKLERGVSVTDACIDFATTERVIRRLASAVRERRNLKKLN